MNNLANLTRGDLENAKKSEKGGFSICPPGLQQGKFIGVTEEETYQYVTFNVGGKNYNFFFNYTLRDSDDLDYDVINWLLALSTIPTNKDTHLIEVVNSAIGSTYEFEVYNYTPKTGKNAGKPQHGIQFSTLPKLCTVEVETEEMDLPY